MEFNIKQRIIAGLNGDYEGLNNGFTRLNDYIFGVQRAIYTLIGGLSGSAKTMLLDFIIMNAIEDAELKGIEIDVLYYSWEISKERKKAIWLSMLIFKKYDKIISPAKIMGYDKEKLTEDEQILVFSEIEELDRIFNKIRWFWVAENPTGLNHHWWNLMSSKGVFKKEPYIDENNNRKERIVGFELNNPKSYTIAAIDHVALAKLERDYLLKQNLDKLSEYIVTCRNLFGMSFFVLQQFNTGLSSVERLKFKGVDVSPQQNDFKDSGNLYQDADIALGLMNAYKMDLQSCMGYNINGYSTWNLKESFRMLKENNNKYECWYI